MVELTEERVAFGLGALGGALLLLGALVAVVVGTVDSLQGRWDGAVAQGASALLLALLGALALLFAYLGLREWRSRPTTVGLVLLVVALLAAITAGTGPLALALAGVVCVALAAVLDLVEPMRRATAAVLAA